MSIAKLEPVPLREIWKKEDSDFSTWLEQNIDALSDALGFNLSVLQREKSTGAFQVDLVAEDEAGQLVASRTSLNPPITTTSGSCSRS
jgi:RecB family endonuclease NucS